MLRLYLALLGSLIVDHGKAARPQAIALLGACVTSGAAA